MAAARLSRSVTGLFEHKSVGRTLLSAKSRRLSRCGHSLQTCKAVVTDAVTRAGARATRHIHTAVVASAFSFSD